MHEPAAFAILVPADGDDALVKRQIQARRERTKSADKKRSMYKRLSIILERRRTLERSSVGWEAISSLSVAAGPAGAEPRAAEEETPAPAAAAVAMRERAATLVQSVWRSRE